MVQRRQLIQASLAAALPLASSGVYATQPDAAALLRQGGVVVAFRHALAPGTFDPPGFRVDDCRTQRNLSEEGREQARAIGRWFQAQGLQPARVRSSPWCRCLDTARLAFNQAEAWPVLASPHGAAETTNAAHLSELREGLTAVSQQRGRFEVWVTHMFVLSALADANTDSGEGLVLRAEGSAVRVLARLRVA
jgi:phosphohistidine phosphatase SixA